jgi:hypothetical protein
MVGVASPSADLPTVQAGLTNLTNLTAQAGKLPPAAPPAKHSATLLPPPAPALSFAGAPAIVAESPTRLNFEPMKESRLLRQVRALLEGTRGRTAGGPAGGPPSSRGCTLDGLCAALSLEPDEAKLAVSEVWPGCTWIQR